MKPIIYDQKMSTMCQTFVIFWALWRLTWKYTPQKKVEEWIKKSNLKGWDIKKEGWLSSREVAKMLWLKIVEFWWWDETFYKYLNEWKPIILSMRVDASFWKDSTDGVLDSYKHLRGRTIGHAVYIYREEGDWMINSFWKTLPPLKFDVEKFDTKWLKLPTCYTITL